VFKIIRSKEVGQTAMAAVLKSNKWK